MVQAAYESTRQAKTADAWECSRSDVAAVLRVLVDDLDGKPPREMIPVQVIRATLQAHADEIDPKGASRYAREALFLRLQMRDILNVLEDPASFKKSDQGRALKCIRDIAHRSMATGGTDG
jgi:hypothetical protein